jgi:hypothetical protein
MRFLQSTPVKVFEVTRGSLRTNYSFQYFLQLLEPYYIKSAPFFCVSNTLSAGSVVFFISEIGICAEVTACGPPSSIFSRSKVAAPELKMLEDID